MRVDLDANVRTRDGHDAGSVARVVIDPQTDEVTAFVVTTSGLLGRDVLISRDELEGATRDGDTLLIHLSKEELDELPTYVASEYEAPSGGWLVPTNTYAYPSAAYVVPVGTVGGEARTAAGSEETEIHVAGLGKGAVVVDRHEQEVGVVDDVRFDSVSGQVTGFTLRIGGVLRTLFGGGDVVEIERGQIARLEPGVVYLRLTKEALQKAGVASGSDQTTTSKSIRISRPHRSAARRRSQGRS